MAQALLRRLEKRILVPLPGLPARRAMLGQLLNGRLGPDVDLDRLAAATEGYSGVQMGMFALYRQVKEGAGLQPTTQCITAHC